MGDRCQTGGGGGLGNDLEDRRRFGGSHRIAEAAVPVQVPA